MARHLPEADQSSHCQKYQVQLSIHFVHVAVPGHVTRYPSVTCIPAQRRWHQSERSSGNGCQNVAISSGFHCQSSLHDHLVTSGNLPNGTADLRGRQHQTRHNSPGGTGWILVLWCCTCTRHKLTGHSLMLYNVNCKNTHINHSNQNTKKTCQILTLIVPAIVWHFVTLIRLLKPDCVCKNVILTMNSRNCKKQKKLCSIFGIKANTVTRSKKIENLITSCYILNGLKP